jgi:hypothetical protein
MKHSLHYTYDAAGNKLKLTIENPVKQSMEIKPLPPPLTSMALYTGW